MATDPAPERTVSTRTGDRRPPGRATAANSAVVVAALASCSLIVGAPVRNGPLGPVAAVVGTAAVLFALREEGRGRGPKLAVALAAIVITGIVAMIGRPLSPDVWAYVSYGRIFGLRHADPYVRTPASFPHDPYLHLIAPPWRNVPVIYGPVFVAYSALGAALARGNEVIARLFHQLIALAALGAILRILWVRTRSVAVIALVALHPVIAVWTLQGAHNDLLVGLAILGAVVLAGRDRWVLAALVLALGALVKIVVLVVALGLGVWCLRRRGVRSAAAFGIPCLAVVAAGYAIAGGAAIRALDLSAGRVTAQSVFQIPRWVVVHGAPVRGEAHRLVELRGLTSFSLVLVLVLAAVFAWRRARRGSAGPDGAAAWAGASYEFSAAYVLPWYVAWVLPVAALRPRSVLLRLVVLQAGFLAAFHELGVHWRAPGLTWLVAYVVPVGFFVAFVLFGWRESRATSGAPVESVDPDGGAVTGSTRAT